MELGLTQQDLWHFHDGTSNNNSKTEAFREGVFDAMDIADVEVFHQ